jgi:hypothetical protein
MFTTLYQVGAVLALLGGAGVLGCFIFMLWVGGRN